MNWNDEDALKPDQRACWAVKNEYGDVIHSTASVVKSRAIEIAEGLLRQSWDRLKADGYRLERVRIVDGW